MSNPRVATEFDQIIQADRERRKNEQLAKSIFGNKNKRDGNNKKDNQRSPSTSSLASRIGVTKRSSSTSSNNPSRPVPTRPASHNAQNARANRLATEMNQNQNVNIKATPKSAGPGLSIKGSAAPFVVEARNFAPGTTDADIESAIQNDCLDNSGINALLSCRITATKPVVIAEMVFTERSVADRIIERYHKQKADGRVLELKLARSGPGALTKQQTQSQQNKRDLTPIHQPTPPPIVSASTLSHETEPLLGDQEGAMEDIDMDVGPADLQEDEDTYDDERQAAERDRRDRESRRTDRDRDRSHDRGHEAGRRSTAPRDDTDRKDDRYRDRERERDRDRNGRPPTNPERERERERDRDRDRDHRPRDRGGYERRGEGRSYNESRPHEPREGGRSSHYGNGVGAVGGGDARPEYTSSNSFNASGSAPAGPGGGGYRGGRTYNDDNNAARGGFGGARRGYRGGGGWQGYR